MVPIEERDPSSAKGHKPIPSRSAACNRADACNGGVAQLAGLRQGPPLDLSVSPVGLPAGGGIIRWGQESGSLPRRPKVSGSVRKSPDLTPPMKIVEFAFIVNPATDLTRSRAFYEGVLGLTSATSMGILG